MKLLFVIIFFYLFGCAHRTPSLKNPDDRLRPFLGLEFFPHLIYQYKNGLLYTKGIKIKIAFPDYPANKDGFQDNDIIVGINGKSFEDLNLKSVKDFNNYISVQKTNVDFVFNTNRNNQLIDVYIKLQGRTYSYGYDYASYSYKAPWATNHEINFIDAEYQKNKIDFEKDKEDLQTRFLLLTKQGDILRHKAIIDLQKNPYSLLAAQKWMLNSFTAKNKSFDDKINQMVLKYMNIKSIERKYSFNNFQDLIKAVDSIYDIQQQAYEKMSLEEINFLNNNKDQFLKSFSENIYIQEDQTHIESNLKMISLLKKIDFSKFVLSFNALSTLLNKKNFVKIEKLASERINKENRIELKTKFGQLIIGGYKDDIYTQEKNVFLIIDLGGNDKYINIDSSTIDLSGDDVYQSDKMSFGFSFLNNHFLYDMNGDDVYQCDYYCFGVGFAGLGILIDEQGNDTYTSGLLSQGVGIAGGIGLLYDHKGDDKYFSKGFQPSLYGDDGQYAGWSQGVGIGLRNFISGGLGLLVDLQGQDRFEAGEFSQGGGYYFGWGLLINAGLEDDLYFGSRYSQGFAAHSALGSFIDEGGNDQYMSSGHVSLGLSWDLSASAFEDVQGDDVYTTCDHCLGAASHSSLAIFHDKNGHDIYKGHFLPLKSAVPNDYHSGISLGLFLDSGFQNDQYEEFKNNSSHVRLKYHLYIDN